MKRATKLPFTQVDDYSGEFYVIIKNKLQTHEQLCQLSV